MSRSRVVHRCRACQALSARWTGRCAGCGEWNSVEEQADEGPTGRSTRSSTHPLLSLEAVDLVGSVPRPTGLGELDRVLGGGFVPGSVTLVGGEPGVGKSTLLLQVLVERARRGTPVLLVSAEESAGQVRLRAERLGPLPPALMVLASTDVQQAAVSISESGAALVVVDSVQAVRHESVTGHAGSVAQVRACAELLVRTAKETGVPVVLVGHVTKDGSLAGPRTLEHLVDTVLSVEGDRHHALRVVRAVKHRYGQTGEVGLLEMGERGLTTVDDPHALLLGDRRPGQAGSVVLPAVEGQRPLLVEVQALVTDGAGRRQAQGLDSGRLAMLLAVLDRHARPGLTGCDVFASVVGAIKVSEPAADLAVALAVVSACRLRGLPPDMVAFGEVGLGGEIRQARAPGTRLTEASRRGFRYALVPEGCPEGPPGLRLLRVGDLGAAVAMLDA